MTRAPQFTVFVTFTLILLCYFVTLSASLNVRFGVFLLCTYSVVWVFRRFGALNPMVWFPPFLLAYMSLYPLAVGNLPQWGDQMVLEEVISVGILSLSGFFFGSAVPCCKRVNHLKKDFNLSAMKLIATLTIFLCLLISIYSALFIQGANKQDFKSAAGAASIFFPVFTFLAAIVNLYLFQKYKNRELTLSSLLRDHVLIAASVVLFFNYSVSGEREALFYIFLMLILLHWTDKARFQPYKIFLLVVAILLLAPITQYMKQFSRLDFSLQDTLLQYKILNNEFISAGRNTFFVLSNFSGTFMNGETILWSFMRYFDDIFPQAQSAGAWFNTNFRSLNGSSASSGWGFSFAAEGYINFGYVGVFMFYAVKGLLISVVYRLSARGPGYFLFYVLTIPTMIYVIRGDLASLLALSFKYNLLFAVMFAFFQPRLKFLYRPHPQIPSDRRDNR